MPVTTFRMWNVYLKIRITTFKRPV